MNAQQESHRSQGENMVERSIRPQQNSNVLDFRCLPTHVQEMDRIDRHRIDSSQKYPRKECQYCNNTRRQQ